MLRSKVCLRRAVAGAGGGACVLREYCLCVCVEGTWQSGRVAEWRGVV